MRFIKYNPDSEMSKYLHTKPMANHLANIIASRARRTDCRFTGLKKGQSFLGDFKKIGLTEQQYRTAKKQLTKINFATFKGTNKGTVATLVNIEVWDININEPNGQSNEQLTDKATDKQRLTKNVKNIKNDKNIIKEKNNKKENDSDSLKIKSSEKEKKVAPKKRKDILEGLDWPDNFTEDLRKVFSVFVQMRKEIKKPYKSKVSINSKLKSLSKEVDLHGREKVKAAIELSIENQYQGIKVSWLKNYDNETSKKQQTSNNKTIIENLDQQLSNLFSSNGDQKGDSEHYTEWSEVQY